MNNGMICPDTKHDRFENNCMDFKDQGRNSKHSFFWNAIQHFCLKKTSQQRTLYGPRERKRGKDQFFRQEKPWLSLKVLVSFHLSRCQPTIFYL